MLSLQQTQNLLTPLGLHQTSPLPSQPLALPDLLSAIFNELMEQKIVSKVEDIIPTSQGIGLTIHLPTSAYTASNLDHLLRLLDSLQTAYQTNIDPQIYPISNHVKSTRRSCPL